MKNVTSKTENLHNSERLKSHNTNLESEEDKQDFVKTKINLAISTDNYKECKIGFDNDFALFMPQ